MKASSFLFALVGVSFIVPTGCTSRVLPQPSIPYKELSGPIPAFPTTPHDGSLPPLFDVKEDPKSASIKLLDRELDSSNRQVVFSALASYSLIQLALSEKQASKLLANHLDPYTELRLLITLYETQSSSRELVAQRLLLSDIPILQLYAIRFLTIEGSKTILQRIEGLEAKLDEFFLPYIVELYALEGSIRAQNNIRRIMHSGKSRAVAASLLFVRDFHLMELFDDVQSFSPINEEETEALAYALQCIHSTQATARLQELIKSPSLPTAIQAYISLSDRQEAVSNELADKLLQNRSPFLFSFLHKTAISTAQMEKLWQNTELTYEERLNLALSLLERHSSISLSFLLNTLKESDQALFEPSFSLARTTFFYTRHGMKEIETLEGLEAHYTSQSFQESLIEKIAFFFPDDFLKNAPSLLLKDSFRLAPAILTALAKGGTSAHTDLIKQLSYTHSSNLVRHIAIFTRIQQGELKFDHHAVGTILTALRESLKTLMRPSWAHWGFQSPFEDVSTKKLTEQQRLYFVAIQTLAQLRTSESKALLMKEVQEAPSPIKPFVIASLLYSLL